MWFAVAPPSLDPNAGNKMHPGNPERNGVKRAVNQPRGLGVGDPDCDSCSSGRAESKLMRFS